MADLTNIGWTDHTCNTWWGCDEVHSGCDHCFARVFAARVGKADAWEGVRYECPGVWKSLAKWQRDAAAADAVRKVFTGSMMDVGEKSMPLTTWAGEPTGRTTGEVRDRFFREAVPASPNLLFQLLTKRPGNIPGVVPPEWLDRWPENVITGASVVDQATADTLLPQLLRVPGRRFLSVEPLLGPVDLRLGVYQYPDGRIRGTTLDGIHWVIIGGESGPSHRPMDPEWLRSVVDQCRAAGVPCFVKQDAGRFPGLQGRLTDDVWSVKQFPATKEAR